MPRTWSRRATDRGIGVRPARSPSVPSSALPRWRSPSPSSPTLDQSSVGSVQRSQGIPPKRPMVVVACVLESGPWGPSWQDARSGHLLAIVPSGHRRSREGASQITRPGTDRPPPVTTGRQLDPGGRTAAAPSQPGALDGPPSPCFAVSRDLRSARCASPDEWAENETATGGRGARPRTATGTDSGQPKAESGTG